MVRVRFAPSPTGYLHVGGARTALFNWLFARSQKGVFILRIEDTDRQRSEKKYLDDILDSLRWLGLEWDEGPYFQSEREGMHKEYARRLLESGLAYYDQPGETEALRFRIPKEEKVTFKDLIRGEISIDTEQFDDLVIVKSDGSTTYNFACVVDDLTMGITHIVRGEDHITNTPKQVLLYRALGCEVPQFAHLPLILAPDRSRLSKRHGAVSVTEYRQKGILSGALFNYLALLGWSPKDDSEVLSKEEIVARFQIKDINKTGATFDLTKLEWMNGQYIMKLSDEELLQRALPFLEEAGLASEGALKREWLLRVVAAFKQRMRSLNDFVTEADFVFFDEFKKDKYNTEAVEKHLKSEGAREYLLEIAARLEGLETFDEAGLEGCIRGYADERGIKAKVVMQPIRVALTGKTASPGLFDVIILLGKRKVLERLRYAADHLCM